MSDPGIAAFGGFALGVGFAFLVGAALRLWDRKRLPPLDDAPGDVPSIPAGWPGLRRR